MSLLEVRDLTVRDSLTGALIVRDVHFCLEPGTCLGVVGESGSGKSTITKLLLKYYEPESGTISVGGVDLDEVFAGALDYGIASLHDVCITPGSRAENTRAYLKAMENPMFSNLIDATWKLIEHEKTGSAIC